MASTREGAELLTQYGWESRWTKRTEHWPLVEDRATLLEVSMDDTRSEAGYSLSRSELGSPVSQLDFIAEEHFQLGNPRKRWSRSISDNTGDKSGDRSDDDLGIHIPSVKTSGLYGQDTRTFGTKAKSQTLPSKYQSMPLRAQTLRNTSIPPSKLADERTPSLEHLTDRKLLSLDLNTKDRSRSLNLDFMVSRESDNKTSSSNVTEDAAKSIDQSVINETKSSKHVPLKITIGDDEVELEESSPSASVNKDNQSEVPVSSPLASDNKDNQSEVLVSEVHNSSVETQNDKNGQLSVLEADLNKESSESKKDLDKETSELKKDLDKETPESRKDLDKETSESKEEVVDSSESEIHKADSSIEVTESVDNKATVIKSEQNQMISISITDTDNKVHLDSEINESLDLETSNKAKNEDISAQNNSTLEGALSQNVKSDQIKTLERGDSQEEKKVGSLKDERSSSSDSSRTTKSRTDSFTTDSTTSGIGSGSFDSGHQGVTELHTLTPIPSSTSLENFEVQLRPKKAEASERAHHSVALRRLSNLSRVPSTRRGSSPGVGLLPISKFFDFSENAITYTTARDAIGYATLRSLMKQRQISSDAESDFGLNNLYDTSSIASTSRRPSVDSTYLEAKRPLRWVS